MNTVFPNRLIVFGGGLTREGDLIELNRASCERVDHCIDLYKDHADHFNDPQAFILCTGGYGLAAKNMTSVPRKKREGRLMAQRLIAAGIPRDRVLVEDESISTLTNWTYSIRLFPERLALSNFSEAAPLGLISHTHHLARVVYFANKLGYQRSDLAKFTVPHPDNKLYEEAVLNAYKEAFKGTSNKPADLEALERQLLQDTELVETLRAMA